MRRLWAALLLFGCGTDPAMDAGSDTPRPDAPEDGGMPVDPGRFDCTAPPMPARVSPLPVGCPVDPACTSRLMSAHAVIPNRWQTASRALFPGSSSLPVFLLLINRSPRMLHSLTYSSRRAGLFGSSGSSRHTPVITSRLSRHASAVNRLSQP